MSRHLTEFRVSTPQLRDALTDAFALLNEAAPIDMLDAYGLFGMTGDDLLALGERLGADDLSISKKESACRGLIVGMAIERARAT